MRLFALGASLGLAVFSHAQDSGTLQNPKSVYQDFLRATGGHWVAHWHPATVTPSAIYGTGLPIADWRENTLAEARRHANQLLVTHRDLLGLGTSEFREVVGARMGRTWSFTFDQFFRGLPVIEGRADVRINMKGVVAMLGSRAWPIPADFNVTPRVAEEVATAIAWGDSQPTGVPQPGAAMPPRLVIWGDIEAADQAPFFLAWEVPISNVDRNGDGPIGRHYIDAMTGGHLHYASDKHTCGFVSCTNAHHGLARAEAIGPRKPEALPVPTTVTVLAWTRTGADAYSTLTNTPLRGLVLNVPGVGTRTTDQNGEFVIDIAAPVTITVGTLDGTHHAPITGANNPTGAFVVDPGIPATIQLFTAAATTNEAAHTTTSYWVDLVNEWSRAILGTDPSVLTAMSTISNVTTRVNIASTCNAYYTGNSINFYNAGGGCANTAFSTVIAHEWGHGLDDRFGGISNTNAEGVSEGWGDILGMYLVDSPLLGSGFQTAGVALRRGDNTRVWPYSSTSPHAAGQVWMGFAWQLREQLRSTIGNQQAIDLSNDIVVGSIVADATTRQDAVREVFIADDNDGNLANGVPHYAQLSAAAIIKGIPYPEIQVASLAHTPLGNTSVRLTPRLVNATAAAVSSGSITQVRLHYNAGAGNQVRNMHPNGALNGYQAMLPGRSSGSVSYHIEAVHSSNVTVRMPATGEYTYVVSVPATGPFVGFYNESFDTGAAGWTNGRYSATGTTDWQLGTPAGKTSTVSGVLWSDPAAAFSGANCYAQDLGIGTSNGRYPNSIDYYLRSPVINCTGRTGVTLRLKRWLTVEEGIYDQATIAVNGVPVWANPQNGNLVDTSWQTVEYAIPAADNNPSVQIEFRLAADAGLNLGGWQIDDVELGTRFTAPLAAELTMLPEQAVQASPINIAIRTQAGPMIFGLVIGDTAGPTLVAGVPPVLVGGSYFVLGEVTDAAGNYAFGFTAPAVAAATGLRWYSQVVTFDATYSQIVTSNQFQNLFTQTP